MKCKIVYMNILFFVFMFSGYFTSCQLMIDFNVTEGESQIYKSLNVVTNRENGVAPLGVSFDLTDTEFYDDDYLMLAEFMWDFGDEGDEYNVGKGYCPSHVYREPGNYTATVTAYYNGEELGSKSVDIEVSEFDGTTYYISSEGSDETGDGSETNPFASPKFALDNYRAPNTRFLLRQGDTFTKSEAITIGAYDGITIEGPVVISSYEDPSSPSYDKPVIYDDRTDTGFTANFTLLNCDDFRVTNLYFKCAGEVRGERSDDIRYPSGFTMAEAAPCSNCILLDCDVYGAGPNSIQPEGTNIIVQDCTVLNGGSYGVYATKLWGCAFIGMYMADFSYVSPEYTMRLSAEIQKCYVAFNDLRADYTNNDFQIRGDDSSYNYVYRNQFDRFAGINQTNDERDQTLHHNTFDANILVARDYDYVTSQGDQSGFFLSSNKSMCRNNIVYGHAAGFSANTHAIVGGCKTLWYHNNTVIGYDENSRFAAISKESTDIEIRNNVFYSFSGTSNYNDRFMNLYTATEDSPTDLAQIDSDYNIFYGTGWGSADTNQLLNIAYNEIGNIYLANWRSDWGNGVSSKYEDALVNTTIDVSDVDASLDAGFAVLDASSPARDSGDPDTIYTMFDFFGNQRTDKTMGAIGQ